MQINLTHKRLHFKKPARTSRGEYSTHDMIIISITDDKPSAENACILCRGAEEEGRKPTDDKPSAENACILCRGAKEEDRRSTDDSSKRIGLGECAPLPDLSSDRDAYTHMSDVARLINDALNSSDYQETLRPYPALLFALESAMYDYQQNPLLYDTPFARSEVGIPTNGLVWMAPYDDMLSQVKRKILDGFKCIKLKIGAIGWEEEMSLIKTIRSRFSKDTIELRVDANGAFSVDNAMSKLEELARYDIHSIEQPIAQYQWKEMANLCRNTPLPIALDEELIGVGTLDEKRALLDTIKPQYIVVKPTLHGGMSGAIEWVSEAQKRGIGSWMTSALESNIGLRNVALLAARVYNITPETAHKTMPQGLGTGMLYTDNIEMDMELRHEKMWRCEVAD